MATLNQIFARIDFATIIDIMAISAIFYWLLTVVSGTRATQLIRGVIVLLLASIALGTWVKLPALTWLVLHAIPVLLLAIPVVFQPELRRALEQLGHAGDFFNRPLSVMASRPMLIAVEEISRAATEMAKDQVGALMILERSTGLQDYADKGIVLDALVTSQLLQTIFFHNSPLHDGAVIVRQDRIVSASCVLPLSENILANQENYGTRHRAAIGISEYSDAIAVVVSEETGVISVAQNGKIISGLSQDKLRRVLSALLRVKLPKER